MHVVFCISKKSDYLNDVTVPEELFSSLGAMEIKGMCFVTASENTG